MTLSNLIRKGGLAQVATATHATVATQKRAKEPTVAKVATVAVANLSQPDKLTAKPIYQNCEDYSLKPGWKNQIAYWPEDFQQCWRDIVEARCQAGEVRATAEALAFCTVEDLWTGWQRQH